VVQKTPVKYLKAHSATLSFRGSFTHSRHSVRADVAFVGSPSAQCLLNVGLCCWMADLAQVSYIKVTVKIETGDF